jgi:hypothetical protein
LMSASIFRPGSLTTAPLRNFPLLFVPSFVIFPQSSCEYFVVSAPSVGQSLPSISQNARVDISRWMKNCCLLPSQ